MKYIAASRTFPFFRPVKQPKKIPILKLFDKDVQNNPEISTEECIAAKPVMTRGQIAKTKIKRAKPFQV